MKLSELIAKETTNTIEELEEPHQIQDPWNATIEELE